MTRLVTRIARLGSTALLLAGLQPARAGDDPPLWGNLGTITYEVTTPNGLVQKYFDQGLRLTYAFNHAEARRAFRTAQQLDPGCALCSWGEALVLGPNINMPMPPSATAPALEALNRARAAVPANEKERALIDALAARYGADPKADRAALDAAYAEAMGRVTARFPNDLDIAVLYAEALMDLSPWDYWEDGGRRPKGRTADIVRILEGVLARRPDHPGAIHLYIHAVEASDAPERAEPYADRLGSLMPGAGHLVHMPSHIYYRVGRYLDALTANKAAVAADEAYLAQVKAEGIYPLVYYPHNIHFLLVAAQMAGDARTVIDAAAKLDETISRETARTVVPLQRLKAAPLLAHAQFSDSATVLALPDPGNDVPYVKAMWHYARGIAHAARGEVAAAQAEADGLAAIARDTDFRAYRMPATELLGIARHVVLARIEQARGDLPAAILELEAAAARQERLAYREPPYWNYPVRQSLGALRLLAGQVDQAEADFRAAVKQAPQNGWALYGLLEVQRARGDQPGVREAAAALDRAWVGDRELLKLPRL